MKKAVIISLVAIVLLGGLVAALVLRPIATSNQTVSTSETTEPTETVDPEVLAAGRYEDYASNEQLAVNGYNESILFFHASWCPECRAFEAAIKSSVIPDGVQILKIDYDSATELRQKYEVPLQSTFVKVNANGEKQSLWVGYGKDKSVNAILENT